MYRASVNEMIWAFLAASCRGLSDLARLYLTVRTMISSMTNPISAKAVSVDAYILSIGVHSGFVAVLISTWMKLATYSRSVATNGGQAQSQPQLHDTIWICGRLIRSPADARAARSAKALFRTSPASAAERLDVDDANSSHICLYSSDGRSSLRKLATDSSSFSCG